RENLVKRGVSSAVPLQWIIPNLYLSRQVDHIVNWEVAPQKLEPVANRYLFHRDRLLLEHETGYLFIGRRKEKAGILRPFLEKTPVLLKGQGGVGKTAMAEHLVQRLMALEPKTAPFVFDENAKSIDDLLRPMREFLLDRGQANVISELAALDKGMEKFRYLASKVKESFLPVFVFDNLETFQAEEGEELAPEFADLKEVIAFLCRGRRFHVILTCRYTVAGFDNILERDLNQVGLTDFRKKCFYLDVGHIHRYLKEARAEEKQTGAPPEKRVTFMDIVRLLHGTFGGNYRALEFFNRLVKENTGKIRQSLDSMERFETDTAAEMEAVKRQMGQNLLFSRLMALLEPERQHLLRLLSMFRVRVQMTAIDMQNKSGTPDLTGMLPGLHKLTLIEVSREVSRDPEFEVVFFYVTPIVKDLLEDFQKDKKKKPLPFAHQKAGEYYYH
ncbi:MAG: hypothetical protein GY940_04640, partial [bacterium]|nr:hypothetical protein [bacterium]